MKKLPCKAYTETGRALDLNFPLHIETESPIKIHQMTTALLDTLVREIRNFGPARNGDVIQVLAITLCMQTLTLPSSVDRGADLNFGILTIAFSAIEDIRAGCVGHA